MTISNEANVNLPVSGALPVNSGSTGASGTVLQRSALQPGAFSEKLSVALDKPVQSETVEKKKIEKTKEDDGEGTLLGKAFQGLPFGLIWSSPVHELLASELNAVKQQGASNVVAAGSAGSQSSKPQSAGGDNEAGITPTPQATIQGTMEKQELFSNKGATQQASMIQPKETAVMGLVQTMTSAEAIDAEHSTVSATTVISEASGTEVGSSVNSSPTGSNNNLFVAKQTGEQRSTGTNPDVAEKVLTPKEPQKGLPIQVLIDSGTMESPSVSGVTAPAEEKQAKSTPNLQLSFTNSKEPQKIVPVQVLVDSGTMKSPAVSTVTASVAEKHDESTQISNKGMLATEIEQQANSDADNGSLKGSLDQSKSDHLQKTLASSDNDPNLVAATAFNKIFHSIDQAPVSSEVAAQPRQELHDVASQIMDGMIASTDRLKSSQIIVTLKPEHLGEVTVKINVDGDKVTAAFHAASSEVRAILESSLPQLKQEMSQQGWNFDSSGVFDGMQGFLANHQQQQPRDHERQIPKNHRVKQDEYDGILAFTSNGRPQLITAAAVDYRI